MRHNDAGIALSAGLLFVGCALSSESFLSAYNLFNISRIVAFSVLVALAQALVLVAGGMNLSVGGHWRLGDHYHGVLHSGVGFAGVVSGTGGTGDWRRGRMGQRGHHHAVADQFLYRHTGHAFCLYGLGAWVFRRLRLYGHSAGIHVFGTAEIFGGCRICSGRWGWCCWRRTTPSGTRFSGGGCWRPGGIRRRRGWRGSIPTG